MNLTRLNGSCQAQNEAFGQNLFHARCENIGRNRSFLHRKVTKTHTQQTAIQLLASATVWKLGDGNPPRPDPVRSKWMRSAQLEKAEREANSFFAELYRETARQMAGVEGGAHTG